MRRLPVAASPPPLSTCERLWSLTDLSEFLGVPVATIYHWRSIGAGPPGYRVGRHVRYDPDQVRAWLVTQAA
jgi:predicted DNA-binding transcriptional regulator AlpA